MSYSTGDSIITKANERVPQTKQHPLWNEIDLSDTENAQIELQEIVEYAGAGLLQKFILEGAVKIQFDVPELALSLLRRRPRGLTPSALHYSLIMKLTHRRS